MKLLRFIYEACWRQFTMQNITSVQEDGRKFRKNALFTFNKPDAVEIAQILKKTHQRAVFSSIFVLLEFESGLGQYNTKNNGWR